MSDAAAAMPAISRQIWDMKYRLKRPDGAPVDATVEDTWRRVAKALAAVERDPALWEPRFYEALSGFKFLPAGRILAGAGAERAVTLFNCFVMGAIPDDMGGIFESLKEAALTMQQGGGVGFDFSTLRPRGAPVVRVGADASGPLSFMDVWDAMCRTIMSAGHRRGAMMATLRCDHPDIEAFVDAKREPGRLRMFNLSVLATDAFMAAVDKGEPWPLVFGGRTFKTVDARALWDRIMQATYDVAEPGVIFIDRINRANNLRYCETIAATNPCVAGDTWVHTAGGPRQARALVGRPFAAVVDGVAHASDPRGFFPTGVKPLLALRTRDGRTLRLTANHLVRRVARQTRYTLETTWTAAGELRSGDRIVLHDHRAQRSWPGFGDRAQGYLLGLLMGDGWLREDEATIGAWPGLLAANGGYERPGVAGVMAAAVEAAQAFSPRADFAGWQEVAGRPGERRLSLAGLRALAVDLGMAPGDKRIAPAVEASSSEFHRGFLRGFFDADGSVQGAQDKGVSIRLSQSDLPRLEATQRMLHRLGVSSTIYAQRRPAGERKLPDGKGGSRSYATAAQQELVVSGDNVARFADVVGFSDGDKAARVAAALAGYRRALNRERFVSVVESLAPDGEEEVFDVSIPGANAFDANGLYVHNCGEQPLPPYGACLLGSINLAALVRRPFEADAALDMDALERLVPVAVRMMDDTIDASRFPLPQQQKEAHDKRRIGLGVTGLADALAMLRVRYGSPEAVRLTEEWLGAVQRLSYLASSDIAAEKGSFPLYRREAYLAGETVKALPEEARESIRRYGVRNALLNSIAPTGTISLFAGNVSSGIEPIFNLGYSRHVLQPDGTRDAEAVEDPAWKLWRERHGQGTPPDWFATAQTLSPQDHLAMQAAAQRYVDSSISKTINLPASISFDDFKSVYREAYRLGCKGCTTYRPNAVTGAVLESPAEPAKVEAKPSTPATVRGADGVVYIAQPLERPQELPGLTYKIKWPGSDHAIYITLNDIVQDGRRRPFEIFINSKNMEHYAWTVALTRMISAVFRRGGDVSFVVEELKAVFDPRGGQWMEGRYVPSLLAAIGGVIEKHLVDTGFIRAEQAPGLGEGAEKARLVVGAAPIGGGLDSEGGAATLKLGQCPQCGAAALAHRDGCDVCMNCGHSRCG